MIIKQVKLSEKDKDRLSRLKSRTGIANWNVLCRWALCFSLSDPSIPADAEYISDSNLEMTWDTLCGDYGELYELLIRERCLMDGLGLEQDTLVKYLKLHLSRGIAYLSGTNVVRSMDSLIALAEEQASHLQLDSAKGGRR